jgi:chitodextrinase
MDLKGTVDVPVVGSVDKRVLVGVGGVAAVFIGWKYYQSRNADAYDPDAEPVDPGMEDPGILPAVDGAVRPGNDYGLPDGSDNSGSGSYGFTGRTDSQWTQYATGQLTASESWSYTAIVSALGKYLKGKALSTDEQTIVQAAIAVAGYPPEHPNQPIVPGGNTKITVAPTGVKVISKTSTTVVLGWNPVAGASAYRAYRSGASTNVGTIDHPNTSMTVSGLQPNTEYSFQVAADSMGDVPGPKSATVKARTLPVSLKAPTGVKVSSIAATAATVSWSKVSGATGYRIYLNGHQRGSADGGLSSYRVTGLSKKTRYSVTVKADTSNQEPGPSSKPVTFTTKSK